MPSAHTSADSPASSQSGNVALETDCRLGRAGAPARKGIAEATNEGPTAHLAGSLPRRAAAAGAWSGSHPCASRLFRLMGRDGGGSVIGSEFQHDAARVGSAAAQSLPRYETGELPVLRNHL